MQENLVIVESPAKAKTIEKFLGKDFTVKSSYGHIRDLSKKDFGIDIKNNYQPQYVVSADKKKIVAELKKMAKTYKTVWLASDEDREGEAIAWHLHETLKLDEQNTRRIVFHEITKNAITHAIENPRSIDINLVNAQQARRVLDRLVGFELSPVLWKKVKPSLSAGRVQSVAVKLLVEREREIINFKSKSEYRTLANFVFTDENGAEQHFLAELNKRFPKKEDVINFLEASKNADFKIADINTKPARKSPAPPFTTSTLQQEASRKFGFSVSQTMTLAQKLYEAGHITYMRTDSTNLSDSAVNAASEEIVSQFGKKYLKNRKYATKTKGAQEAHEAIRPTYMNKQAVSRNASEQKLYELIWKRTIASQMSDAEFERTQARIAISDSDLLFMANGEVMKFDGFLKVYIESTDDDAEPKEDSKLLPPLTVDQMLDYERITARQRFSNHPPRYTEASLVKKLEELGIGRPSTYAPTISTVLNRGYVVKESREGTVRSYTSLILKGKVLKEAEQTETTGNEKNKLFPTDTGMVVTDFLDESFKDILNYNFTAKVEKQFDEIADGKIIWYEMIDKFYKPFHNLVEKVTETASRKTGMKQLGTDPESGKPIFVRLGKYGPMAQMGETSDNEDEKPRFAGLLKDQHLETITLEEALKLFKLPRTLGQYEDKVVVAAIGRFGPYVRHDSKFVSLKKDIDDPFTVTLDRAIELIEEKREADRNKFIKSFDEEPEIQVLNGRWGPYISYKKKNYKIPKTVDPAKLTLEECRDLIEKGGAGKSRSTTKKATTKTDKTKKTTAKKTPRKKKP